MFIKVSGHAVSAMHETCSVATSVTWHRSKTQNIQPPAYSAICYLQVVIPGRHSLLTLFEHCVEGDIFRLLTDITHYFTYIKTAHHLVHCTNYYFFFLPQAQVQTAARLDRGTEI